MPGFAVPTVDLGPYVHDDGDRRATARTMDAACRDVGFVQVVGHGVDDDVVAGLARACDAFFGLPASEKGRYRVEGANRGYSPPRSESLALSAGVAPAERMNDFFEAFNVGTEARSFPHLQLCEDDYGRNVWPAVAGFRDEVERWFAAAGRVARVLTTVFADALGVDHATFAGLTDHSIDVLRLNHYALPEGVRAGELVGMGEHTDFGIVTVLWADDAPGLQVLDDAGAWHDVSPAPGALLVNLGDLTARLTGDRWRSTLHRVVPPVVDGRVRRRRSAAFFHDGNVDAVVATLPGHADAAYPPITVGEHIAAKLAGSRGGRRTAAGRETERLRAARDTLADRGGGTRPAQP